MLEQYIGYEWSMYIVFYLLGMATMTLIVLIGLVIDANKRGGTGE